MGNASLPVYPVDPPGPSPGLDPAQPAGMLVTPAGTGVLAAFGTFPALGLRRASPSEGNASTGETPPEGAEVGPLERFPGNPDASDLTASEPPSPAPSPRSEIPRPERRRASDEILLHLGRLGRPMPDELADPTRTQAGMSAHLGLPQNVESPVLRRLAAAGAVAVEVRHVGGGRRRPKVYRLTDRGESVVRELRRRRWSPDPHLGGRGSPPGRVTPGRPRRCRGGGGTRPSRST
ncbi:MAG TPA: hypothetical protein VMH90_02785 [Thermoplasmata archaeon]|nr:hypothetical protein [Thermoplasmata archaeon]